MFGFYVKYNTNTATTTTDDDGNDFDADYY